MMVTGWDGFIGAHVCRALESRGHFTFMGPAEITAQSVVEARVRSVKPDAIVHLAAQASVLRGLADPALTYLVNVVGTQYLATAAARHEVEHVVFASSGGCVYGDMGTRETPWEITSPLRPFEPYGTSKVWAEQVLHQTLRGRASVLRLANVYGPGDTRGVVAKLLAQREAFQVNGDGRQTRDFVHVDDVARCFVAAVEAGGAVGTLNVGTGRETSVLRLAEMLGIDVVRPPVGSLLPAGEVRRNAVQADATRHLLLRRPWTPLETGTGALLPERGRLL